MSLAPAIHPDIRGVEGKRHPVERTCAAPGCISLSQHGHHMWARSYLRGQPTEWVSLPSGKVVSNVVGLCVRHHDQVTGMIGGHGAMIRMEEDETFVWLTRTMGDDFTEGWLWDGLLAPQPFCSKEAPKPKSARKAHLHLDPGQTCGSCGYTAPPTRTERGPKRKSASWNVSVPNDAEIGAEVLDDMILSLATILGLDAGDVTKGLLRYHTLAPALAWVIQNRDEFIADIIEAGEA